MTGTPVRLAAYAGALALAFGAAYAVGASADPVTSTPRPTHRDTTSSPEADMDGHAESTAAVPTPAGLAVTDSGYTLVPAADAVPAGRQVPFRFTVTGPDGRPVTAYERSHEKDLHLIVVRRDLEGFQHVHPTRAGDGSWAVPLDLAASGSYRVFADFVPAALGRKLVLGADLSVAGDFRPVALPGPAAEATVDGYDVSLAGSATAGEESELTFTVAKDGAKVTDLQPYLGAFGHLVSLRAGDLAYLHTHPAEEAVAGDRGGPQVRFTTTFPTAGTYRLFLDFRHDGVVRTVAFTVTVDADGH